MHPEISWNLYTLKCVETYTPWNAWKLMYGVKSETSIKSRTFSMAVLAGIRNRSQKLTAERPERRRDFPNALSFSAYLCAALRWVKRNLTTPFSQRISEGLPFHLISLSPQLPFHFILFPGFHFRSYSQDVASPPPTSIPLLPVMDGSGFSRKHGHGWDELERIFNENLFELRLSA